MPGVTSRITGTSAAAVASSLVAPLVRDEIMSCVVSLLLGSMAFTGAMPFLRCSSSIRSSMGSSSAMYCTASSPRPPCGTSTIVLLVEIEGALELGGIAIDEVLAAVRLRHREDDRRARRESEGLLERGRGDQVLPGLVGLLAGLEEPPRLRDRGVGGCGRFLGARRHGRREHRGEQREGDEHEPGHAPLHGDTCPLVPRPSSLATRLGRAVNT